MGGPPRGTAADIKWWLGPHKAQLFDSAGNAGPTVWWDGRIVGGWRQDEAGAVVLQLLEDVGSDGRAVVESEAERLTEWLGGTRILIRFPSPLWQAGSYRWASVWSSHSLMLWPSKLRVDRPAGPPDTAS